MQSHVLAELVFERYVWYFGSLHPALEMSCDTEYLKKTAFDFFGNVVCIVLYCVQLFRWFLHKPCEKYWAISLEAKQKISKKTLSTFQKYVLERCSAFFFGCNQRNLFWEPPQISLLRKIRVFCSNAVTFRLRQFSKARFSTLAFYILHLRCLVISNTYKDSSCFLRKTEIFQNDFEYVPKSFFWALVGLLLWL